MLDTCVLINATDEKNGMAQHYLELFRFMKEADCVLVTSSVSNFEYLRGAKTCKERQRLEAAEKNLGVEFPMPDTKRPSVMQRR